MSQTTKVQDVPGLEQLIQSSAKELRVREYLRRKSEEESVHGSLLSRFAADPGSDPLLTLEGPMTIDQVRERFALLQAKADAGELN